MTEQPQTTEPPDIAPLMVGELPYCDWKCPQHSSTRHPHDVYPQGAICEMRETRCEALCFPAVRRMAEELEKAKAVTAHWMQEVVRLREECANLGMERRDLLADSRREGRREALEEAAKIADGYCGVRSGLIAQNIRSLAEALANTVKALRKLDSTP